jgi:hypothetical protein
MWGGVTAGINPSEEGRRTARLDGMIAMSLHPNPALRADLPLKGRV